MAKKTELNDETARAIANALGVSRFEKTGYEAKAIAQKNLKGKTHYVDDDTLRFFHARIASTYVTYNGLIFAMVESVANDMHNRSRGFRFVAFDLFGTVINERAPAGGLPSKKEKAERDMWAYLETLDVLAHYKAALAERAARLRCESDDMAKAAKAIKV